MQTWIVRTESVERAIETNRVDLISPETHGAPSEYPTLVFYRDSEIVACFVNYDYAYKV